MTSRRKLLHQRVKNRSVLGRTQARRANGLIITKVMMRMRRMKA